MNNNRSANLFAPTDEIYPEERQHFHRKIREVYNKTALWINQREIGIFELEEYQSGKNFFQVRTSGLEQRNPRPGFRKVFQIGAIAPGGSQTIAHELAGNPLTFFHIFGAVDCDDGAGNYVETRPLPYSDASSVTDQIQVVVNATDVVITNGASALDITSGIVVLEYLKN